MYFLLVEGVVEGEGMILHILGDAVYLVLWLVDLDLWVRARNRIYLATLLFLLEDGSLADADCQLSGEGCTLSSLELV